MKIISFCLPLYDAIQTDSQLKISYKKGDAKILEGEQNKAKKNSSSLAKSFGKLSKI